VPLRGHVLSLVLGLLNTIGQSAGIAITLDESPTHNEASQFVKGYL